MASGLEAAQKSLEVARPRQVKPKADCQSTRRQVRRRCLLSALICAANRRSSAVSTTVAACLPAMHLALQVALPGGPGHDEEDLLPMEWHSDEEDQPGKRRRLRWARGSGMQQHVHIGLGRSCNHWDSACSDDATSSESDAAEAEEVEYKPRQVRSPPDAMPPVSLPHHLVSCLHRSAASCCSCALHCDALKAQETM